MHSYIQKGIISLHLVECPSAMQLFADANLTISSPSASENDGVNATMVTLDEAMDRLGSEYVNANQCVCVCMRVCVCVCVYARVCVRVCVYIYIHI